MAPDPRHLSPNLLGTNIVTTHVCLAGFEQAACGPRVQSQPLMSASTTSLSGAWPRQYSCKQLNTGAAGYRCNSCTPPPSPIFSHCSDQLLFTHTIWECCGSIAHAASGYLARVWHGTCDTCFRSTGRVPTGIVMTISLQVLDPTAEQPSKYWPICRGQLEDVVYAAGRASPPSNHHARHLQGFSW